MKGLLEKLKGLDYKQAALQYGDKVGFALICLVALYAVAQANWGSYDKVPTDLASKAQAAEKAFQASKWPETAKAEVSELDAAGLVQARSSPVDVASVSHNVPMSPKLYPRQELVNDIELVPVQELIAYGVRTVFETYPGGEPAAMPFDENPTDAPKDGNSDSNRPKTRNTESGRPDRSTSPGSEIGRPGATPALVGAPADPTGAAAVGAVPTGSGPGGIAMPAGYPGAVGGGSSGELNRTGKGVRFVSLVGIVPHKEILNRVKTSWNLSSHKQAASLVNYLDLAIERRKLQGAGWSAWEQLDYERSIEVVLSSPSDIDVVKASVRNDVFTWLLPTRLIGFWTDVGSHPSLREYLLNSEKEREEEEERIAKAMEAAAKSGGKYSSGQRRGMAGQQADVGLIDSMSAAADAASAAPSTRPQGPPARRGAPAGAAMPAGYPSGMGMPAGMPMGAMPGMAMAGGAGIVGADGSQFKAEGSTSDMLLFRYFDFSIQPGVTYQYRVQVVIANPAKARQLALEQVKSEDVIKGDIRETPWSEPSNPVETREELNFFVASVPRNVGRTSPGAVLDVYQWDKDAGSLNKAKLKTYFGQAIGGVDRVEHLNVIKETFKPEEVTFSSETLLIDSMGAPTIALADHPQLELTARQLDRLTRGAQVDWALALNQFGELVPANALLQTDERQDIDQQFVAEQDIWKDLKTKAEEPETNSLDAFIANPAADGATDGKGKSKRPRRSSSRLGAGGMMPGMGAAGLMPGMGAGGVPIGPGGAPGSTGKTKTKTKR